MNRSRSFYVVLSLLYMSGIFALSSTKVVLPASAFDGETPNALGRILILLLNFLHVPLFGGFTWVVHRAVAMRGTEYRPGRTCLLATVATVLLYSLADELHQSLTPGRIPSAFDVVLNATGAAMALGIAYCGLRRFRVPLVLLVVFALVVTEVGGRWTESERWMWRTLHQRLFPIPDDGRIAYFASLRRWGPFPPDADDVGLAIRSDPERAGGAALEVSFPAGLGRRTGIRSKSMPVDWSGVDAVVVEVTNPTDRELRLGFALRRFGGPRFDRQAPLPPGTQRVRFSLNGLAERFDPTRVRAVHFYLDDLERETVLTFDAAWIERLDDGG